MESKIKNWDLFYRLFFSLKHSALVVVEKGGHAPVLEYAVVPLVGEVPDAEQVKIQFINRMQNCRWTKRNFVLS